MLRVTNVRHAWPNPAGFTLNRKNGHPEYTFLHFITSVELRIGGQTINVPEHACVIYSPKTPQYFTCYQGMLHDWFHFTDLTEGFLEELQLPTDTLLLPKQWDFITELVEEMENEFFAKKERYRSITEMKATELFIKLSRSVKMSPGDIINKTEAIGLRKLRSKVKGSLSRNWTVEDMAKELNLSKSRFAHLYRAFYSISPVEDIIHMRIDAAKNALLFTDASVREIAEALGYLNTTHFYRQFRKLAGASPLQYKKDNQ